MSRKTMDISRQKLAGDPENPKGMRVKANNRPRLVQKAERSFALSVIQICQYSDKKI